MDDNQFVSIIMTSVGEEYDNLITALDCRNEEELTLDLVKCKLLDEYERKSKNHEESEQTSSAFQFSTNSHFCDFCKTKGHVKKSCSKFAVWLEKKKKSEGTTSVSQSTNAIKQVDSDDNDFEYLF